MASISPRKDRDGNIIGYRAQVRRKGHAPQVKTFRWHADAERWAREVEAQMDRGAFVDTTESEATTLREALDRYVREVTSAKRGAKQEESHIAVICRHPIADAKIGRIGGKDVAKYRDDRLKVVLADTVDRELNILSHLFTIAQKEWQLRLLNGNPIALIRRPRGDGKRDRRISPEEEARLLEAARRVETEPDAIRIADIIVIAIETAMRRGEIAEMRWDRVNLAARTVHLPKTKTDAARSVPLSRRATTILESLPRRIDGTVWGQIHPASITRAFTKAVRRAGLKNLRLHDLRHEAVSRLFEETDLDAMEIMRISGHKTFAMVSRYTHLRADRLVARLDGAKRGA